MIYVVVFSDISYYIKDIALLKLDKPVRLTDHVNTVCMPESHHAFSAGAENCEVIGWGSTMSGGYTPGVE